jgi:hypothetical protein
MTTYKKEEKEEDERRKRRKGSIREDVVELFYVFYYLFSDALDDGNSFLIIEEELRGLTRTCNIFPGFCTGLPDSSPAVSPTITIFVVRNFGFLYSIKTFKVPAPQIQSKDNFYYIQNTMM